jgi:hypothetical protein
MKADGGNKKTGCQSARDNSFQYVSNNFTTEAIRLLAVWQVNQPHEDPAAQSQCGVLSTLPAGVVPIEQHHGSIHGHRE